MATRPDPLNTLQLSIELLSRIPRQGTVSTTELKHQLAAAGFGRQVRSTQRLLKALRTSDLLGVECDSSTKPYQYRWKEGAKRLSLGGLSTQESLLLTLAEQQLRALLPTKLMKSMEGFFSQAKSQLSDKPAMQPEREWLNKVRVVSATQPLLPPKINPGVFEQVSDALFGNQWLDVDYKNAQGKRAKGRVMPLGLAQQGPCMYLVCRYEGYDNERLLALHRMNAANTTPFTFVRPPDFNLKEFDDKGRFGFGDGTKVRLQFRIEKYAGLHIVECPLSLDQKVVERADTFDITATVVDSNMLDWWLRGFGDAVSAIKKGSSSIPL